MKAIALFLSCLFGISALAQVKGRITNATDNGIAAAGIAAEGTGRSAAANENGYFYLDINTSGDYTFTVRAPGYKTKRITAGVKAFPHVLYITLERQDYTPAHIPAEEIIKNAINAREANARRTSRFTADFYSKGTVRIKDVPKEILGQELGDLGGSIDSTRSGILYLSETLSELRVNKPKMHERITGSKVSGEAGGYSFNNADAAEFDFYRNYIPFDVNVVSPIADNAFSYYEYESEGTFTDSKAHIIHKIKVSPKRETAPAMTGYIYIVEGSWELYGTELSIKGSQIRSKLLNTLTIKQSFGYDTANNVWTKNVQWLDFEMGAAGVEALGSFTYLYSNYNLNPQYEDWGNEILYFEKEANARENAFWYRLRPIPLTNEEIKDYTKKDSIQYRESTTAYKDSTDRLRNRLTLVGAALGYTYYNSKENWEIYFSGLIRRLGFNTVQAYNTAPSIYFTKTNPQTKTYTSIGTDLNYGFAENRFRATGAISRKYNNFTDAIITLSGGSSIEQFNPERPINRIVNTISTLFFRENYMKLYDNTYLRLNWQEEVVNGLYLYGNIEYTSRRPLFNNTDFSTLKDIYKPYTSNNPLLPYDYETPAFLKHNIMKASVAAKISFGQKYRTLPYTKENIPNEKYPEVYLMFEKGFASSIEDYNFNHLSAHITQDFSAGSKGELGMALRAGKFFDSDNISFIDYRHFNGNQTHIGKSERYLNVFNFLPYYTHSTNDAYIEGHAEHNFKGFITNKIPFINQLNYHLVAGYHILSVPERKPYMEFTVGLDNLGWGKFRFLRVDYIRSYESGFVADGVIFGITFLDILE